MMVLQALADGLDRWGGALERWPAAERREAEALLATSAEARVMHERMIAVEAVLTEAPVDTGGLACFAAIATRHPQQRRPVPAAARRAGWGAAVAAALALGLIVGDVGRGVLHDDNPESVLASALDPGTGAADVD